MDGDADESAAAAETQTAEVDVPAADATQSKPPTTNSALMDFDEEEDEDDDNDLLNQKQPEKRKKIVASDVSEEEEGEEEEEEEATRRRGTRRAVEFEEDLEDDEVEENGNEDEAAELITSLSVPNLDQQRQSVRSTQLYQTRLPRFLFVQRAPFNSTLFDFTAEKEQIKQCNGERILGDEIIRWRPQRDDFGKLVLDDNEMPQLESNANVVEFEDGTFQLFVGDHPVAMDIKTSKNENDFIYSRTTEEDGRLCLQALARTAGHCYFRPTAATANLRSIAQASGGKTVNIQNKILITQGQDPETYQDLKSKELDARARSKLRKRNRAENSAAQRRSKWDAGYLEEDSARRRGRSGEGAKRSRKRDLDEEEEEEYEEELADFIADDDEEESAQESE